MTLLQLHCLISSIGVMVELCSCVSTAKVEVPTIIAATATRQTKTTTATKIMTTATKTTTTATKTTTTIEPETMEMEEYWGIPRFTDNEVDTSVYIETHTSTEPEPTTHTSTSSARTKTSKSKKKYKNVEKDEDVDNNQKKILTIIAAGVILLAVVIFVIIYMRRKMNPVIKSSIRKTARRRRSVSPGTPLSGKSLNKLPVESPLPSNKPVNDADAGEPVPKYKAPKPKKMKSAELDYKRTKQAPLVMKKAYKGNVKHDLENDDSKVLSGIEFDPKQDSIVYIGTQVEKIEGTTLMDQQSTLTALKTAVKPVKSTTHHKARNK